MSIELYTVKNMMRRATIAARVNILAKSRKLKKELKYSRAPSCDEITRENCRGRRLDAHLEQLRHFFIHKQRYKQHDYTLHERDKVVKGS
jgi:hypothetical protein